MTSRVRLRLLLVLTWLAYGVVLATAQPVIQALALSHPGSYDYVPSIVWDTDRMTWRAYWCGFDGPTGDGIFTAESTDRVRWTPPRLVLRASPGQWDGQHACDPSVLHRPGGEWGRAGWRYVMYYMGGHGDTGGKVGVALSMDGDVWQKFGGNPILDCGDTGYGCGQLAMIQDGDLFLAVYVQSTPTVTGTRRALSWDGYHFFDDQDWSVWAGCAPGMDLLHTPGGAYLFQGVFTKDWQEQRVGAVGWGAPWVWLDSAPMVGTQGSGFYRGGHGERVGAIWSAFGTPPVLWTPADYTGQELQAVRWPEIQP
jgi:hypothetical protein